MKQKQLASLPTKETGVNILYMTFLFISNQFICKQSWHVKLLMLAQAHRNQGGGGVVLGAATPQIFAKVDLLPVENDSEKKKVAKKYKPFQIPRIYGIN